MAFAGTASLLPDDEAEDFDSEDNWEEDVEERPGHGVSGKSTWYESPTALLLRRILRGRCFQALSGMALLLALIVADSCTMAQVPTNVFQDCVLTPVFLIFAVEFVASALCERAYPFSFLFWMDLLGTASMVADISFFLGADVSQAESATTRRHGSKVIVLRAARAARLGARAGRLSRVVKLVRFLPGVRAQLDEVETTGLTTDELAEEGGHSRTARRISNHLTSDLSKKVAIITIVVVVVVPLFGMFTYPQTDNSLFVWTQLLAKDAAFLKDAGSEKADFHVELQRFNAAYTTSEYGPFRACAGSERLDGTFECQSGMDFLLDGFSPPKRRSSTLVVSTSTFQTYFNLSLVKRHEALASLLTIFFVIFTMIVFSLIMSSDIGDIALVPLERCLAIIRRRCAQIILFAEVCNEDDVATAEKELEGTHQLSEITMLEKTVAKLMTITQLAQKNAVPEVNWDHLSENDLLHLNFRGYHAVDQVARPRARTSQDLLATEKLMEATGSSVSAGPMLKRLQHFSGSGNAGCGAELPIMQTASWRSIEEQMQSWSFSTLDLSKDAQLALAVTILTNTESLAQHWRQANVDDSKVLNFVRAIEATYKSNFFHNFQHALDVLFSVCIFMRKVEADAFIEGSTQFGLLISALGHDAAHPGVNNPYLVESSHELSVQYNDNSPCEMMHCATLFEVLSNAPNNVFARIEKDIYRRMRKDIVDQILHTDIATKHNAQIKELTMLYEVNSDAFDVGDGISPAALELLTENQHHHMVLNCLLHTADVANPMKPWELCKVIANLVLDEYFAQGDEEKRLGLPVQMLNDRHKVNRPQSQIGFIEFLIAPLVIPFVRVFPSMDFVAEHLTENLDNWAEDWLSTAKPPQETVDKTRQRVQKVVANGRACCRVARGLEIPRTPKASLF